jgi:parvulin-like peptidyl-prolyl isomerase
MKLRMLVIKKNEGDDGRRKTIVEIRQKIASGASFEDLARLYSEDSSTQESGGDWGWINRRTLTESLTKTAFALKPGEVSPVIEMAGNYYLLFCEAKKPGITKPLSQVRDEILKLLMLQDRQQAQEKWLAKLRKAAYIKIFWVK